MGFFDDLVVANVPAVEEPRTVELGPPGPRRRADRPPMDHYLPGVVDEIVRVGASEHTRVLLTGWSVWPGQAVLHLAVFRRRYRTDEHRHLRPREQPGGLRVGLVFPDGRRVTTLDGAPYPRTARSEERISLRVDGVSGGGFRSQADLHLSALPPAGELEMVVEWPDREIPETHTRLWADPVRAAAERVVEIWPDLRPPAVHPAPPRAGVVGKGGPGLGVCLGSVTAEAPSAGRMAGGVIGRSMFAPAGPAQSAEPRPDPGRYAPRPGWEGVHDWTDLRLVRARLTGGADPDEGAGTPGGSPLHRAATGGSAEVVAALAARSKDVDAPDGQGCAPLLRAVCRGRDDVVSVLLGAGADAWRATAGRSPADLALRTPMAPLFAVLARAVPLTADERERQAEADALIAAFQGVDTFGLGVAFAGGVDEEEAVRRLGGDPAACPVLDLDRRPGPYGTGPGGFDPDDFEESLEWVGVTGVPGGVVVCQPMGYRPTDGALLTALSRGTTAYGVYFNPKGGVFGHRADDGAAAPHEELGRGVGADSPEGHWLFRLWQQGDGAPPFGANALAYACWAAGMRLADHAPVTGPPRRWVRVRFDDEGR